MPFVHVRLVVRVTEDDYMMQNCHIQTQSQHELGLQGGILFWLRGNLRDGLGISPEIAVIKNRNNDRKCI